MWRDIWNVSYIELRIWSQGSYDHRSYGHSLSNCVQKPEKVRSSMGLEPVISWYRCDALTNWAMKLLTLRAGHLWVVMSPWGMNVKLYLKCFIYWTADVKSSKLWSSQLWTQFMQLRIYCFSIVRKYGHLQKFSLRTTNVYLVVASPLWFFSAGERGN